MLNLNNNYLDHLRNTKPTHISSPSGDMNIAPLNTIVSFGNFNHSLEHFSQPRGTLNLNTNYLEHLSNTKPTQIGSPSGGMADIGGHTISSIVIAPLNTNVSFSNLKLWNPSSNKGLSAISDTQIPKEFNWRYDKKKGKLIAKPGNQMLCGSCWAISAAGIIGDNFVVSGLVNYVPNISTTWILVCYPQLQCGGGNPALAFQQIADASVSNGGVVTNHCIDYSWCETNPYCNKDAKKHMDSDKGLTTDELNDLIPKNCGCYNKNVDHMLFKLKDVHTLGIGMKDYKSDKKITEDDWKTLLPQIKKHILLQGPVLGGFLVFKNFMDGVWTKTKENKGIYFEKGIYNSGKVQFSDDQVSPTNFKGSHAIAIIGWGVEKDVLIDNNGKKEDVPYWYCRNSWTEEWGDGGYFKMAMYPYNILSQFDKEVTIKAPSGYAVAGGIVLIKAMEKPENVKLNGVKLNPNATLHTSKDMSYYSMESNQEEPPTDSPDSPDSPGSTSTESLSHKNHYQEIFYFIFLFLVLVINFIVHEKNKDKTDKKYMIIPISLLILMIILGIILFLKK